MNTLIGLFAGLTVISLILITIVLCKIYNLLYDLAKGMLNTNLTLHVVKTDEEAKELKMKLEREKNGKSN